jgi:hypothetical protein
MNVEKIIATLREIREREAKTEADRLAESDAEGRRNFDVGRWLIPASGRWVGKVSTGAMGTWLISYLNPIELRRRAQEMLALADDVEALNRRVR